MAIGKPIHFNDVQILLIIISAPIGSWLGMKCDPYDYEPVGGFIFGGIIAPAVLALVMALVSKLMEFLRSKKDASK